MLTKSHTIEKLEECFIMRHQHCINFDSMKCQIIHWDCAWTLRMHSQQSTMHWHVCTQLSHCAFECFYFCEMSDKTCCMPRGNHLFNGFVGMHCCCVCDGLTWVVGGQTKLVSHHAHNIPPCGIPPIDCSCEREYEFSEKYLLIINNNDSMMSNPVHINSVPRNCKPNIVCPRYLSNHSTSFSLFDKATSCCSADR